MNQHPNAVFVRDDGNGNQLYRIVAHDGTTCYGRWTPPTHHRDGAFSVHLPEGSLVPGHTYVAKTLDRALAIATGPHWMRTFIAWHIEPQSPPLFLSVVFPINNSGYHLSVVAIDPRFQSRAYDVDTEDFDVFAFLSKQQGVII